MDSGLKIRTLTACLQIICRVFINRFLTGGRGFRLFLPDKKLFFITKCTTVYKNGDNHYG